MTEPEVMLWARVRRRSPEWPVFRNQHPLGPYILDFFCPAVRLAIEVDGAIHGEDAQAAHDERRDAWLESQGVTVLRVSAYAVFRDAIGVADGARRAAAELVRTRGAYPVRAVAPSTTRSSAGGPPPPSSSGRGRQA